MSDQDRVHEPSPIRLMQAREDGIVARSADLSRALTTCVLLGSMLLFAGTFQSLFTDQIEVALRNSSVKYSGLGLSKQLLALVLPVLCYLAALVVLSLVIWHLQSPLILNFGKTTPDFSRLSVTKAFGRIFSPNQLVRILIWIIGLAMVVALTLTIVWRNSNHLASIAAFDFSTGMQTANFFLRNMLVGAGVVILILGIADYVRERVRVAIQLRMSDQERRDEARNTEMSPELRRRLMR